MHFSELPTQDITCKQVLDVILRAEQRRRVVWTAGRILKEEGSLYRVATGSPNVRRSTLRRIRRILKELVRDGVLAERGGTQFNYGTTNEVSYDLVSPSSSENSGPTGKQDESN
jgi:hypothetical protein